MGWLSSKNGDAGSIATKTASYIKKHLKLLSQRSNHPFDRTYSLYIDYSNKSDREFVNKMKGIQFPEIRALNINLKELTKEEKIEINDFMTNCFTQPLSQVAITGVNFTDLSNLKSGVSNLAKLSTYEFYICNCWISQDMLKIILENCFDIEVLIFSECQIDIRSDFVLNHLLEYKIRALNLYGTCNRNDKRYLDKVQLNMFLREITRTDLVKTLESIHVWGQFYPVDEVIALVHANKVHAAVLEASAKPVPNYY